MFKRIGKLKGYGTVEKSSILIYKPRYKIKSRKLQNNYGIFPILIYKTRSPSNPWK